MCVCMLKVFWNCLPPTNLHISYLKNSSYEMLPFLLFMLLLLFWTLTYIVARVYIIHQQTHKCTCWRAYCINLCFQRSKDTNVISCKEYSSYTKKTTKLVGKLYEICFVCKTDSIYAVKIYWWEKLPSGNNCNALSSE